MAVITGGDTGPLDTRAINLADIDNGTLSFPSQTNIGIDLGGGVTAHLTGTNFILETYDAGPSFGLITGISEDHLGQTIFDLTGLNLPAAQLLSWAANAVPQPVATNHEAIVTILSGDDRMTGTNFSDYIEGFDGHDNLVGGAGSDTLLGDAGNDHLYGQSANGGADMADSLSGGDGADYLQGNAGNDTLDGGAGSDRINGGADDDLIIGDSGNDTVNGNLGNDTISGGDGADSLRGGQGDDSIDGGAGDDVIYGDLGVNTLTGGAGHDVFQFAEFAFGLLTNKADVVTDYESGIDHLALNRVVPAVHDYGEKPDAILALRYFAETQLSHGGQAYDVAVFHQNGDTIVLWETPGSLIFDRAVILRGDHPVTVDDFV